MGLRAPREELEVQKVGWLCRVGDSEATVRAQELRDWRQNPVHRAQKALGSLEANGQVHQKRVDTPQVEGGRSPVTDRGS